VQSGDDIPTIDALRPFHGYFKAMRSTACNNRYLDHTHHVKGTTGGQQGDGMEMTIHSLSQHPIIGRVLDRHRSARAVGFADDLTIYAALKKALKVLVEMRQRLGEDAKLRYNMGKLKIYIPGVSRERARELVLRHIDQDPSLQVTKHIMQTWTLHEQMMRNPSTDRMRDVHKFHHTQSVPMLDENSALRGNMPQRNDAEGGKNPRLSFSPASSVWGQMGRPWTTDGRNAPRTTKNITEQDYVAFFHQFLGFTNNPALAPFANVQCRCQRYFMGGDGSWDHLNSCIHPS
jgi:hypothetical protein